MPVSLQIFLKHITKYTFLRASPVTLIGILYITMILPTKEFPSSPTCCTVSSYRPRWKVIPPNPSGFALFCSLGILLFLLCYIYTILWTWLFPSTVWVFQFSTMYFQIKFLTSFWKPLDTILWRRPISDSDRWASFQFQVGSSWGFATSTPS